ncbi:glycoside hydrolase family 2 protein [Athelia psychrophila]|uniref:Beta-mannosidase A n=1 Tax=Athelia psychrophila TaxID=1759441 RepID=A0A166A3N2_9AGAM|nr:glycoside hydrolase family 2 protein [Fibularhizoctonia sp. CBS 109695]
MLSNHHWPWAAPLLALGAAAATTIDLTTPALKWTLTNGQGNVSVPAAVPSHAQLDLFAAGVVGDPLLGENNVHDNWVGTSNWTYTSAPIAGLAVPGGTTSYLIFDGLDTFAAVSLCNTSVASVNNQFRRWSFDVSGILAGAGCAQPVLEVAFTNAPAMAQYLADPAVPEASCAACFEAAYYYPGREFMRKEQSDFGWDWAPALSPTGIWLPARIVQLASADIHVQASTADVYRLGQQNNLPPSQSAPFVVNASIDYLGALPAGATLHASITGARGQALWSGALGNVTLGNGTIGGHTVLEGKSPALWWPVGYGAQALYNLTLSIIVPSSPSALASASKRIGFRTLILNQTPVSAAQLATGIAPGNNWHFEVNGRAVWAKGSNLVPLDAFWPRVTAGDFQELFEMAVAGNQNMLRVWASGAYLPDAAYDLADELGLMLWSELQFSDALYPTAPAFVANVLAETSQQVRRINHHPSLALWAGNNEIEYGLLRLGTNAPVALTEQYGGLFVQTLLQAVWAETRSVSYSPSSTTNGYQELDWAAGLMVERLGNVTEGSIYGSTDYYDYDATIAFNLSTYPVGRFANEFGFHSQPSYQTYAAALPPADLAFNSSGVLSRNHHYPINLTSFFSSFSSPAPPQNRTARSLQGMGELSTAAEHWLPTPRNADATQLFKAQILATQIFQAEFYRAQIAFYRRGSGRPERTMGSLYWMLNDIWAAPTWAGIERGGRWKMLHYGAKDVYAPVVVAPYYDAGTGAVEVWVTSDLWDAVAGTATVQWYDWAGRSLGGGKADLRAAVEVGAVNSTRVFAFNTADVTAFDLNTAVAVLSVEVAGGGAAYAHTHRFVAPPLSDPAVVGALVDPRLRLRHAGGSAFVVEAAALAAFVWLDHPAGVRGYWSDNGFWMLPGARTVTFTVLEDSTGGGWADEVVVDSLWTLASSD